jgi:MFS superfamily sulfate permease-like transporter
MVLAVIALPLNAAVALASGVPVELGLASALFGAAIAGTARKPALEVIAPAAALAVPIWGLLYGAGPRGTLLLGPVVGLAGVLQLVIVLLRLTAWFRVIGPAVVRGVMTGVGVVIVCSQAFALVDLRPHEAASANLFHLSEAFEVALWPPEGTTHHVAAVIGLGAVVAMVLFSALRPARFRTFPVPLLGLAAALALALSLDAPVRYLSGSSLLDEAWHWPSWTGWKLLFHSPSALLSALVIAIVSSSEGLLCATSVEEATGVRADLDQTMLRLAICNVLCALVGALPVTAVVMRSRVNLESGGRSRLAVLLHGALIGLVIVFCPSVVHSIPAAGAAAILMFVGWRLLDLQGAMQLQKGGSGPVLVWFAAAMTTAFFDPLAGILVGSGVALALLMRRFLRFSVQVRHEGSTWTIHLTGAATFLRLPRLSDVLAEVPDTAELHISLVQVTLLDDACLALLRSTETLRQRAGGRVVIEWQEAHRLAEVRL